MKIYGRRNSLNVQKVMWLVGELELPHEHVPAGGSFGGLATPEFRARNPFGRVPVIDDAGFSIWESHTILRYLAARYGRDRFWSDDPAQRSLAERWMDWSQTAFQVDFLGGVFWGFYRTPEAQRNWPAIRAAIAQSAQHVKMLEAQLQTRACLAGDALSLADIAVGSLLYRYFELEIERPQAPRVEEFYARLCARPAYREHVMVPFDDLRGRLAF